MKWTFRGNDRGYFCPNCNSRCLCATDGDWLPSGFCPHCGQPLDAADEPLSPHPPPLTPVKPPYSINTAWKID